MAAPLIDPKDYPSDRCVLDLDGIQQLIPHRHEFTQVHSILDWDVESKFCVGFRKGQENDFWERGHVPGRPIFPGVLMVEAMAQTGVVFSFAKLGVKEHHDWVGFAGFDNVRFHDAVGPNEDLWIPGHITRVNPKRGYIRWSGQIIRANGELVAEANILGMPF